MMNINITEEGIASTKIDKTTDVEASFLTEHWKECWMAAGYTTEDLLDNYREENCRFLQENQVKGLQPRTFVARTIRKGDVVGSIQCQIWSGPVPWVIRPEVFRLGSIWGLHVSTDNDIDSAMITKKLVNTALSHLQECKCSKVVTQAQSPAGRDALVATFLGFESANMLTLDLVDEVFQGFDVNSMVETRVETNRNAFVCSPVGSEQDDTVYLHWRKMWIDVGIPESALIPNMQDITLSFIQNAREKLHYQTFVARCEATQKVVASLSCQVWQGPFPKIIKPTQFQLGTIWAVYVDPKYRRHGIATALMKHAMRHLRDVGCKTAILIAASTAGQRVYESLGFAPNNALVCDLANYNDPNNGTNVDNQTTSKTQSADETTEEKKQEYSDRQETSSSSTRNEMTNEIQQVLSVDEMQAIALSTSTTQQLNAVYGSDNGNNTIEKVICIQKKYGVFVDPADNWFTQNLTKFGRGFDMKELAANATKLAIKFDRLSAQYDHWTVGNRSKVESFIAQAARKNPNIHGSTAIQGLQEQQSTVRVLDVACGIGLQGQVLRLLGFRGELVGTDISPGMVERVKERQCYTTALVANANQEGLLPSLFDQETTVTTSGLFDVVICTGAMELFSNPFKVLQDMAAVTKNGGEIWVSFQLLQQSSPDSDKEQQSNRTTANPTKHQHVVGMTQETALEFLRHAGFGRVQMVEACDDAFYTPALSQDGTVLPVPYLFVVAQKEGSAQNEASL